MASVLLAMRTFAAPLVLGLFALPASAQDADGDLVPDASDGCVAEAETYDGLSDADGCPEGERTARVHVEGDELVLTTPLRFDLDDETLRPETFATLDEVALLLRAHPELGVVRVEGHMDPATWEERANMSSRLWHDRAEAVAEYLVSEGVPRDRLVYEGLVTDRPRCDPSSVPRRRRRACRRENDRIVFRLAGAPYPE